MQQQGLLKKENFNNTSTKITSAERRNPNIFGRTPAETKIAAPAEIITCQTPRYYGISRHVTIIP